MTPENDQPPANTAARNKKTALAILCVVAFMTGLSFAAVPLYSLFCKVTGFGGTTQTASALPAEISERTVSIRFNADTDANLPWDFKPEQHEITLHLGQKGLTAYHARNRAKTDVTGTAVYNVTPMKAGKYFHKIECFCFGEQTLKAGQDASMPVMFFVDPKMNDDPNMDDVTTITLSYTFYKAGSQALDKAMDEFTAE